MTVEAVDKDDIDQRRFFRAVDLSQAVRLDLVGICHEGRLTCWQDPDKKKEKEIKTSRILFLKGMKRRRWDEKKKKEIDKKKENVE